ncbi:MAG: helix-turn-helix transcriptional regulator [Mesorhizobium sp.]
MPTPGAKRTLSTGQQRIGEAMANRKGLERPKGPKEPKNVPKPKIKKRTEYSQGSQTIKARPGRGKSIDVIKSDQEIGERIRYIRTEIEGLDQRSFAARLGVSNPAVAQWEAGNGITRANTERIAEVFEISREWLLAGKGTPKLSLLVNRLQLLLPEEVDYLTKWADFTISQRLGPNK